MNSETKTILSDIIENRISLLPRMNRLPPCVNILTITPAASAMVGIRNIVQRKFIMTKVTTIRGSRTSNFLLSHRCNPKAFSITWNTPCKAPQTMNVQFAPCHIPLTRKVTRMFQWLRNLLQRLPPRGIYT